MRPEGVDADGVGERREVVTGAGRHVDVVPGLPLRNLALPDLTTGRGFLSTSGTGCFTTISEHVLIVVCLFDCIV